MTAPFPQSAAPLAALAGATLLASMGGSIATVALPSLAAAFPASVAELQWVILAYLLTMTVTIVAAGRLGDIHGHRRLLLVGLGLFIIASLAGAASPGLGPLFAARAAQGVGAAVLTAMPMSIVRSAIAADRTGAAMGLLGTMSAIGTALGPSVGGLVMARFGWQAAFLLLATGGVAVLALVILAVPRDSSSARTGQRMDWVGSILLTGGLGLYAVVAAGAKGFSPWGILLLLILAALALWLFVVSQQRVASPMVPLGLLRSKAISTGLAINLLVGAVMMATLVVGALFLSFGLGLDPVATGMVMAVGPVTAALAGIPAGRLTDRLGYNRAMMIGLAQTALGTTCLALLPVWCGVAGYIGALIVLTPGFQLFLAANNSIVMRAAPDAQRGMVSGLLGLSRNLGLLTGASAMATLFGLLVGTEQIATASPGSIGVAFTTVFLVAAGLVMVGMGLARHGRSKAS